MQAGDAERRTACLAGFVSFVGAQKEEIPGDFGTPCPSLLPHTPVCYEKKEEYRYGAIDAENTICIALLHTTASPGRCADTCIADHMALSGRCGVAAQHVHLQCVMPAPALPDQHLLLGVRHQLRALVRQRRNQCQCSESPPKHHYTDYQLTE